jgi:DNA mismatch repair protein MutS
VARLAGVPPEVNERAKQILAQLEAEHMDAEGRPKIAAKKKRRRGGDIQLTLFGTVEHPVMDEIRRLDLDQLSPMQAFQCLQQWQEQLAAEEHRRTK